jgi:molybdopterin biosynthesis enzyme MoaB
MVHRDIPLKELSYFLVTVSTTRTFENDDTGKLMQKLFEEKGKKMQEIHCQGQHGRDTQGFHRQLQ